MVAFLPCAEAGARLSTRQQASRFSGSSREGFALLLTGLPGAGKSTLATELTRRLSLEARQVTRLDGDELRARLSMSLGFSEADRAANLRIASLIASEVVRHQGIAVCAFIAPYVEHRAEFRAQVERNGRFFLAHVSTPLEECERRDPKGLYAKARNKEVLLFTGISDMYEEPYDADIRIDTSNMSVDAAVDQIVERLGELLSAT